MIANVLLSKSSLTPMGVVIVDRKNPTCYDQRNGIIAWLQEHLNATNIVFIHGGEVHFTAGGNLPYRAEYLVSRSLETVVVKD